MTHSSLSHWGKSVQQRRIFDTCRELRSFACTQKRANAAEKDSYRDRNGATNIGFNFKQLMRGRATLRSMSEQDLAFHSATVCLECD